MQLILRYIRPYLKRISLGMTCKFLGTIMDLCIPWVLAHIIDAVIPLGDRGRVFLWGGAMVLCSLLALLGNVLANRVAAGVARDSTERLRHDLFAKIASLQSPEIDRLTIPSLISRMTTDTYFVYRMIGMMQRIGIRAPILLIGGVLITMTLDPALATILVAMLPFMALAVYLISKKGVPLYAKLQASVDGLVRVVRENASGVRIIKALSKTEDEKKRFERINQDVAGDSTRASVVMSVNGPTMQFLLNFGLVVVVVVGAGRVNAGDSDVGKIIAFLNYFTIILNAMLSITRVLTMYSQALASSRRIQEVLDGKTEGALCEGDKKAESGLVFDHVTFSYNKKQPDLHDISFSLQKGQSLGILGPTGAGKSTVIKLLMRFYDVDEGAIRIDGRDIRALPLETLRGKIGVVFQNDALFRGTVGENIRLGRDITEEELNLASARAQAEGFISQKGGLTAQTQTRGMNFSGGQQQRLLLSRALAGHPEILLLDDATSALDFKTEAALRRDIRAHHGDATTIIIAQRISAVMHCDQILVLEDGEEMGYGTHESLMRDCPLYKEIVSLQIGGEAS